MWIKLVKRGDGSGGCPQTGPPHTAVRPRRKYLFWVGGICLPLQQDNISRPEIYIAGRGIFVSGPETSSAW
jgi:hypothetical protein